MIAHRTRPKRIRHATGLLIALSLLGLVGCGARQMPIRIEREIPPNPTSGLSVHIAAVEDGRTFVASSADPVPHQMATEGAEDAAIRARSIAQIRNASARPVFDLLLPEGQSAASLTKDALTQAFRSAGFIVMDPSEPGFAESVPVNAEIVRFWSWNTGSWTFTFQFEAVVSIVAEIPPFEQGEDVRGYVRLRSAMGASAGSFRNSTNKGLDDFVEQLRARLAAGRGEVPDWATETRTDDAE